MDKPVIKIQLTTQDKIAETAGYILLAALWCLVVYFYNNSPDVVPIHFNLAGKADGYGTRKTMFITPVICTFLFLVLTQVSKYPETFNYAVTITPQNAKRQYTIATRLLRGLKIIVILIFGFIDVHAYLTAIQSNITINGWLMPLIFIILFIPVVYYFIKSLNAE